AGQQAGTRATSAVSGGAQPGKSGRAQGTAPAGQNRIESLLQLEDEARKAPSVRELGFGIVNSSRKVLGSRQCILLLKKGRGMRARAVSGVSEIDRNAPTIRSLERGAARFARQAKPAGQGARMIVAVEFISGGEPYPFDHLIAAPLRTRAGKLFGCVVFAREQEWDEADLLLADRLSGVWSHAWEALEGPAKIRSASRTRTLLWMAMIAAAAGIATLPVPMTALGKAFVAPRDPIVAPAPLDGVVASIAVEPNQPVKAGDELYRLEDVALRNRVELARREVDVANSRHQQALRLSFTDPRASRDLAVAEAELKLKTDEYEYAVELLDKTIVRAPEDGVALFTSKDDWRGKPVKTGERVMRIANPAMTELAIEMPVADAIVLKEGAPVRLFLDSSPLEPIAATVTNANYLPSLGPDNVLGYSVRARFDDLEGALRIGLVGTAQISGDDVSLAYYLLRKPIARIRQWTGL
ncbi:MAG TPA: HlyD family efflux transporter periplasmic adaptor subunit, partial [Rhizobiaceae bacterium]|nr:HlyD family efflux transporter periplasmic adaptor subunit [Rhizobiaceae bacterium]